MGDFAMLAFLSYTVVRFVSSIEACSADKSPVTLGIDNGWLRLAFFLNSLAQAGMPSSTSEPEK
jgi:hypothetical protein